MNKSSLFSAYDVKKDVKAITLPDGQVVHIRPLNNRGADAFDLACLKTPTLIRSTMLRWTLCDEAGDLLCSDKDLEELSTLPKYITEPLVEAAMAMNKISDPTAAKEAVGE